MENLVVVGLGAVGVIIVLYIIVRIAKSIKPMSEEESLQHDVNKFAAGSDQERYHQMGKSVKRASKRGGCVGWFIVIAILAVLIILGIGRGL